MAKLPAEIRVQVARNTCQDVWGIDTLLDLIQSEIEAREISEKIKAATEQVKRPPPPKPPLPTAGTFLGAISKTESTVPKCVYCSERHFSASCNKVTDINTRRDILRRDKSCFMCLKKGHLVDQCNKSCRNCKRRHHQSICQAQSTGEPLNSHPPPPRENSFQSEQETQVQNNATRVNTANAETPTTQLTTATSSSKGSVLLQTATAVATSEDQSKSMTVRILFDGGSQRSYIADNVRRKLGLKSAKIETLHLNTFEEGTYRKQRCEVVTLPIRTIDYQYVAITALNFPIICSPLKERVNLKDHLHLQELELADSAESLNSIDILIGSDHYWDFVTGESIRGEFGPTAVKSKLGWLLSGPTNNSQNESNVVSNLVISESQNESNVVSNLVISDESFSNGANESDEMADMLKRWNVKSLGIVNNDCESELVNRKGEITFNGSHYEVELPWKGDCLPQSSNYGMCVTRLRSLHSKLKKEPYLLKEYDSIIQEQRKNGIVEIVPENEDQMLD